MIPIRGPAKSTYDISQVPVLVDLPSFGAGGDFPSVGKVDKFALEISSLLDIMYLLSLYYEKKAQSQVSIKDNYPILKDITSYRYKIVAFGM